MAGTLRLASFAGIQNGQAIIRFPQQLDTFARQWSSNGKKEQIANALTELRGEPTGVKFEVGEVEANQRAGARQAPPVRLAGEESVPEDPLVKLIVQEFGGRIVKVE